MRPLAILITASIYLGLLGYATYLGAKFFDNLNTSLTESMKDPVNEDR